MAASAAGLPELSCGELSARSRPRHRFTWSWIGKERTPRISPKPG